MNDQQDPEEKNNLDKEVQKLDLIAQNADNLLDVVFDLFFDKNFNGNIKIEKTENQKKPLAPL